MHSAIESFLKWSKTEEDDNAKPHMITTNVEHPATELPLKHWEQSGRIELTVVPVSTETGAVSVLLTTEADEMLSSRLLKGQRGVPTLEISGTPAAKMALFISGI